MKYKLQMEPEAVLDAVTMSVTRARGFTDDVEWSAEDGSRTDPDFLCRCVEAAIKAGATTINIPDTVGYSPSRKSIAAIFTDILNRVSRRRRHHPVGPLPQRSGARRRQQPWPRSRPMAPGRWSAPINGHR
jgi:isopropylmalate/homocitrate/citramalate synthase